MKNQCYYNTLELPQKGIFIKIYIHKVGAYRFNWHKEIEIMWLLNGNAEVCVEGDTFKLQENDVILINSNCGHASLDIDKNQNSLALVLQIDPVYFSGIIEDYDSWIVECCSAGIDKNNLHFNRIRFLLAHILTNIKEEKIEKQIAVLGHLALLVSHLLENFSIIHTEKSFLKLDKKQDIIKKIMEYSEKHYAQKISLDDIARIVKYSKSYLSAFFKASTGVNYYDCLTRIRLRYATIQLIKTQKPIAAIALDNGFADVKSFNAFFKKYFKKSPYEYRESTCQSSSSLITDGRYFVDTENEIVLKKIAEHLNPGEEKHTKNQVAATNTWVSMGQVQLLCTEDSHVRNIIEKLNMQDICVKVKFTKN